MTKLSNRKTQLRFTTAAEVRLKGKHRAVVVEADNKGYYATVRLAGTRQRYAFSWEWLFWQAADLHARIERDRRKKERAERRKGKA